MRYIWSKPIPAISPVLPPVKLHFRILHYGIYAANLPITRTIFTAPLIRLHFLFVLVTSLAPGMSIQRRNGWSIILIDIIIYQDLPSHSISLESRLPALP
ncbi:hypothetical protein NEOLI_003837 [Neolecta irregularis DAH-3]|uniref:Uncharacterized protein n=1 Tax=Neolecta irregularis (strain DAH-3) TaxID=1198029 RepID=A0A1U7LJN9_NEOID|nr:hypothetical protein NEOLI_003837 [Neolecta irregularis DAH-3]|eukprot:OLL22859.1 hypothetical protein NEOLI_003837 [Neolecta irregularis DAH-3]